MAMTMQQLETVCMEMISTTGEGRGRVFDAIEAYASGNICDAKEIIEDAEKILIEAHQIQFLKLMQPQAEGEQIPFNLILLHAMDLLMITTSEKDMVSKLINSKMQRR